ncbi:MAG: bifunctional oligoribonuclease/PAP phosphatase NrnA [Sedimentisphaerales bacterium]|nr:bifunctional oligoribonuclease/PAP phosphatase NrnA [Sedimentisphaerales bacterium]
MVSAEQFKKAIGLIDNSKNVLLTSHTRPDGDACGSMAAMCDILTSLGKKANPIFLSPLAGWYEFLFHGQDADETRINPQDKLGGLRADLKPASTNHGQDAHATEESQPRAAVPHNPPPLVAATQAVPHNHPPLVAATQAVPHVPILGNDVTVEQLNAGYYDHCDLIIIIDTNSYIQLPQFDSWLKKTHRPVLVIDHHVTSDGIGTVELIDTTAAAAGQIVLDLFRYAKWAISPKIAEAFYVSLSTDTGWFRFSNTDSRVYRDAADLIDAGAKPAKIYRQMYQNYSLPRMKLLVTMLNSLELHFDGRFAMQQLMWADFERTGSSGRETENLIDECQRISSVEVAALFVELKDGKFRCSLRSKGTVDVAKIASLYGGGGHTSAAGVTLSGTLEQAKKLIFDAVSQQF